MVFYPYYGNISGMRFLCLLACLALSAGAVHATTPVQGHASVHDGDTIKINGTSIRIWGIDAVELKQTCERNGTSVDCGKMARDTLTAIIAGRDVTCAPKGKSYKRVVATCKVNGADIAAVMTRQGMAHDYTHYSRGFYAADEKAAKRAGAGIWSMSFDDPAHWRACNLPQRKNRRPADCV